MLDLIDHAANGWRIFQSPGPVHFVEPQTDQSLALILTAANRATDLSYRNSRVFISHYLMPFLLQLVILLLEHHRGVRQYLSFFYRVLPQSPGAMPNFAAPQKLL